jgi:cobalamin biosynthesis protein CobD/CbiB
MLHCNGEIGSGTESNQPAVLPGRSISWLPTPTAISTVAKSKQILQCLRNGKNSSSSNNSSRMAATGKAAGLHVQACNNQQHSSSLSWISQATPLLTKLAKLVM